MYTVSYCSRQKLQRGAGPLSNDSTINCEKKKNVSKLKPKDIRWLWANGPMALYQWTGSLVIPEQDIQYINQDGGGEAFTGKQLMQSILTIESRQVHCAKSHAIVCLTVNLDSCLGSIV